MSIRNHSKSLIDFDFVELRFAPVLRIPRPQGERRKDEVVNMGGFTAYRDEEFPGQVLAVEVGKVERG